MLTRRNLLTASAGLAFAGATASLGQQPVYIGDMHYHAFFPREGGPVPRSGPVGQDMASGQATLVTWSLAGDLLWTGRRPQGFGQVSDPKPGEPLGWFQREIARIKRHAADQKLKIVRRRGDVDRALRGEPHVVLAVEGASFIENDPGRVRLAFDAGVRSLQLVHFIRNTIGDIQTEKPEHDGLTPVGRAVVEECNRLGMLIDLAHASPRMVAAVLAITKAPPVWSHSSIVYSGTPAHTLPVWRARQLSLEQAKAIAAKGGVVGLWALKLDAGATPASYGDRLAGMAERIGEDHVGFGTDLNGLIGGEMMSTYADVRKVVDHWQNQRMPDHRLRKLAIENYARVLKSVLPA